MKDFLYYSYIEIKTLLYVIFAFMHVDFNVAKALMVLMFIDSVLGIIKALKLGEKFSFKVLMWGITTKLSMLLIPMILALIAKGIGFDFTSFVSMVIQIIIVSEGISCITNILSIKSNKKIENTDYITMLLNTLRNNLGGLMKKFLKGLENIKKAE